MFCPAGLLPGEESFLGLIADHGHPRARVFILFPSIPARVSTSNRRMRWYTGYTPVRNRLVKVRMSCWIVAHALLGIVTVAPLVEHRGDALDHRHFVADVIHVGEFQADFGAGLGPARLRGSAPGEDHDHVGAPGTEDHR